MPFATIVRQMIGISLVFILQMVSHFLEMEGLSNCPAAIVAAGAMKYNLFASRISLNKFTHS